MVQDEERGKDDGRWTGTAKSTGLNDSQPCGTVVMDRAQEKEGEGHVQT